MFNIPLWFCCLNPAERGVLRECLASFEITLGTFMPCVIFNALWLAVPVSADARKAAFVEIFSLTETEMIITEGGELECVYTFDIPAFWLELAVFSLTPAGACLSGCPRWQPL